MTDLVQVNIKCTVVTARYGTLSGGDILRTDAEFAKHLVEDCGAGEYVVSSGGTAANADGQSTPSVPAAGRKGLKK